MNEQEKNNNQSYFYPSRISEGGRRRIGEKVEETRSLDFEIRAKAFREASSSFAAKSSQEDKVENLRMAAAYSILSDLLAQGWKIDTNEYGITVETASFSPLDGETVDHAKKRIRAGLEISSNRQLGETSVQDFLRRMEKQRDHKGKTVSVLSLIDDGTELATVLDKATRCPTEEDQKRALSRTIRPVLQECATDAKCDFTGLKLQDIWRYFRYTWSLEYNPLPGRTQRFLIRNSARKNQPIIGIAMLASPTANLGSRDKWIGWQIDAVAEKVASGEYQAASVGGRD